MSALFSFLIGALLGAIFGLSCDLMNRIIITIHLKPKADKDQET